MLENYNIDHKLLPTREVLVNPYDFYSAVINEYIIPKMKDDAERILNENGIVFDKYYWFADNKLEICKNEAVDIMIDDDHRIIRKLNENRINSLYFRDTNLVKLDESEFVHEVNNWGDIYRYITERNK